MHRGEVRTREEGGRDGTATATANEQVTERERTNSSNKHSL